MRNEISPIRPSNNQKDTRRYETGNQGLDNFGKQQIGKSVIITMRNGRSESGILRGYGQYDIALELTTKRILIVMKHAIDTVSIL
jgi:sRNA-binding regulator protein Hfq